MFKILVFIFAISLSFWAYADSKYELHREGVEVSENWKAGAFLIYDCTGGHFACVNKSSFTKCKEMRTETLSLENSHYLPCAPLKMFKGQEKCIDIIYDLITRPRKKSFCEKERS